MGGGIPPALRVTARDQAGMVSRQQALRSGLTRGMIGALVRSGWWRRVHPGVYATFTGPVTRDARLWAAVLCAGRGAYLSHETAAEVNHLTGSPSALINVTIPASRRIASPEGVVIHLSSRKRMIWTPPGIPPYTTAEETVIDLVQAATDKNDIIALITSGFNRKLLTESHLRAVAQTRKKLRWRQDLDEVITMAAGGAHSVLEYRHDRDVQRAHGLPEPVKQAGFRKPDGTNGYRDRFYPQYGGLVIELDGKRFHPDEQRGRDRERDNQAAVTGATLRYDWSDVTRRTCETARQEADALRHRGWTGSLKPCSPDCRAVTRPAAVAAQAGSSTRSACPARPWQLARGTRDVWDVGVCLVGPLAQAAHRPAHGDG
ncbi:MAG: type IV toxin-antitoxin system AbiEi family antitoxin domain-containing protein [Trebonia sp.]